MVRQVRPAVVRIIAGSSVGTGFIFQLDGEAAYVMTNHHVIAGYSVPTVRVRDSDDYNGSVISSDSIRDLAVIRICCGRFTAVDFAEETDLVVGAEIVNIGYALGLSGQATVSTGIISAVRYDSHRSIDVIQTDASINPGNSGGPMLTLDGRVLGVNTFKYVGTSVEGVGFALSGPHVKGRIPHLLSGQVTSATPVPQNTPVSPTPTSMPTPTPSMPTVLHGPLAGRLELEWKLSAILMAKKHHSGDMGMEATFHNPPGVTDWYYGFIFAREHGAAVLAIVFDDGYWAVSRWIRDRGHRIEDSGRLPLGALKTGGSSRNHVRINVEGDAVTFYVNGERASRDADISVFEIASGGDFGILVSGDFPRPAQGERGPVMLYENYQVWKP